MDHTEHPNDLATRPSGGVRKHSCPLKRDLSQKIEDVSSLTQTLHGSDSP
jgi:hypothetical protein